MIKTQDVYGESIATPQQLEQLLKTDSQRKSILLVDANLPVDDGVPYRFGDKKSSGFTPFGLKRIQSYLSAKNVPCYVKHIESVNQDEIGNYDIVGISALSPSIPLAFEFARQIKQRYPNKTLVGGSEHFGLDSEWILENNAVSGVDACCTMQGELPLLALGLGVPIKNVGSMAYTQNGKVISNAKYPRLTESSGLEGVLAPSPVVDGEVEPIITPELVPFFNGAGSTQTNSGCNHACTFCTNGPFYGKAVSTMETAKREVEAIQRSAADFVYVRDPMLNVSSEHLQNFMKYMQRVNEGKKKLAWYSFMSVSPDTPDFSELAKAGALMIGVGLEDVVGDRRKLGKGNDLSVATRFTDSAKEHLMVRALLLLGLPNHYQISKDEIKGRMLEYMKAHPQTIYRLNILTPTPGTADFRNYADVLIDDPHKNPSFLRRFDNMHSLVDPQKMREKLGIAQLNGNPDYVQTTKDWEQLRSEITFQYLNSAEHRAYLETLRGKEFLGRRNLVYDIANKFMEINGVRTNS